MIHIWVTTGITLIEYNSILSETMIIYNNKIIPISKIYLFVNLGFMKYA